MRLFSYVVQHDYGHAPNPYHRVCTLAWCKHRKKPSSPKNVVELAEIGDWVVGTGGADLRKSAGHGRLIYAMKVEEKLTLGQYCLDRRFQDKKPVKNGSYKQRRGDNKKLRSPFEEEERFVLIAWRNYYYFGENAPEIPLNKFPNLEKKGLGWRADFSPVFISRFEKWLRSNDKPGKHGEPWGKKFKLSKEEKTRGSSKYASRPAKGWC